MSPALNECSCCVFVWPWSDCGLCFGFGGGRLGGQAYRWIADSRDEASKKRLEALDDTYKLYRCAYAGARVRHRAADMEGAAP